MCLKRMFVALKPKTARRLSAGCLFIGALGHDDGEGVGVGAFSGGVGGPHDDFPLGGREVGFFVALSNYRADYHARPDQRASV